uniref:Uncharacterized protein n=1 Tax=Strix occidentalis caurina TaxID=311401 RepID=A0A8D0EI70_STROC
MCTPGEQPPHEPPRLICQHWDPASQQALGKWVPSGKERSRHSQPCHLLTSCVPHQWQHPILFHIPTPGPVPRTSLNFLAKTFFLQDVLPVSNALMCSLKVLPKSVLDNSQFVTQDDCLSK